MAGQLDPKTGLLTQAPTGTTINESGVVSRPITAPVAPAAPVPVLPQADRNSLISATPQAGYIQGYDTNNNYNPVFVPKGKYVPGISPTPKQITTESLQPAGGVKLPGATQGLDEAGAMVAGANTSITEILKSLSPPETETDKKQQSILDQMVGLAEDQGQMGADTLAAEQQAGIPELRKQVASLNGEIQTKLAEYNVLQKQNENKPITMSSIIGNERAILNAKAADIGLLTARATALNGNLEVAQQNVDRAIGLKYATIEARLNTYQAQLNALLPTLSKEEKQVALAQQVLLDREKQSVADKKEKEKQIQSVMLQAVEAGVTDQNILGKISAATSIESAISLLGQGMPDRNVAAIMSQYPDAGITPKDTLATAQAKIKNSRIYQDQVRAPVGGGGGGGGGSIISTGEGGSLTDYDILAEAVSNKLGSVSAKNSFKAQYAKAKTDEERLKILAANAVLPAEVKNGLTQNTQVIRSLDDVIGMLDKGVKTGLLEAGQSYLANKLGTGGDKQVEAIKSKLITAIQPYRNKVTGAAWGTQEEAEYQALLGSVKFTPDDLRNKLNVFKNTLRQQSQSAIMAGIDPLGAINQNSVTQNSPSLNTTPTYSISSPGPTPEPPAQKSFWSKTKSWLFGN
jgi:hypothetical protein